MGGRWGHWRVIGGNYACSSSEDANLTRPLLNCPKDPALAARVEGAASARVESARSAPTLFHWRENAGTR
jgi:hypothetical protein